MGPSDFSPHHSVRGRGLSCEWDPVAVLGPDPHMMPALLAISLLSGNRLQPACLHLGIILFLAMGCGSIFCAQVGALRGCSRVQRGW